MEQYDTRDDFTRAMQAWDYDTLVRRGKVLAKEAYDKRATLWERQMLEMMREEVIRRRKVGLIPPAP